MSYLEGYLKVIPQVDGIKIKEAISANEEIFTVADFTEEKFKEIIDYLALKEEPLTAPVNLTQKVVADPLNDFYSKAAIDLIFLFTEQNLIEGVAENYDRIYQGNLEDLKNEAYNLEKRVKELDMESEGEEGLVVRSYSFEPTNLSANVETDRQRYSSLFMDRDGTILESTSIDRNFHKFFTSISRDKETNLLLNSKGETSARLKLLYESPYTVKNENPNYTLDKIIDGNDSTFWFNVSLKPDNASDSVYVNPEEV